MSGEAAGETWYWSPLAVKGLTLHPQAWSMSNFPCSLTINIIPQSMENLAFYIAYSDERWTIYYIHENQVLFDRVLNGESWWEVTRSFPSEVPLGERTSRWHHTCVTWDGHSGNTEVYLDGILEKRQHTNKRTLGSGVGAIVIGQEQDGFDSLHAVEVIPRLSSASCGCT